MNMKMSERIAALSYHFAKHVVRTLSSALIKMHHITKLAIDNHLTKTPCARISNGSQFNSPQSIIHSPLVLLKIIKRKIVGSFFISQTIPSLNIEVLFFSTDTGITIRTERQMLTFSYITSKSSL
jgi:hypothetical protein